MLSILRFRRNIRILRKISKLLRLNLLFLTNNMLNWEKLTREEKKLEMKLKLKLRKPTIC